MDRTPGERAPCDDAAPCETITILCATPAATESLGGQLGGVLAIGDLLDLRGDLGAGKTCLSRGLARGLGVTEGVRSPTFTICHVHHGRAAGETCTLFHIDAYRLDEPEELLIQGWDEMRTRGVVVLEWGERVAPLLPPDRLAIDLAPVARGVSEERCGSEDHRSSVMEGASLRRITVRATGPRSAERGRALLPRLAAEEIEIEPRS